MQTACWQTGMQRRKNVNSFASFMYLFIAPLREHKKSELFSESALLLPTGRQAHAK
jgi:hypothetical protein